MARLRKIDASLDRQIITGMIVSDRFLRSVSSIYKPDLLTASFATTVAGWCLDHLRQYDKAPGPHIEDVFHANQRAGMDDDQADLIESFLEGLSEEYERADKFNVDYLLDQTERLFRQRAIKHLAEDIEAYLSQGELEEAEGKLTDFRRLERPVPNGINPLKNIEAYQKAFESREEPLFQLPGAYGEMLNPHFIRSGFISFLGKAKSGKTWRLIDIAMRATKSRCNVAVFQLGDLSQDDYMVRQGIYLSGKSNDQRYCGELFVPILDCEKNQTATCKEGNGRKSVLIIDEVYDTDRVDWLYDHTPCTNCQKANRSTFKGAVWWSIRPPIQPLTWREAWRNTEKWCKRHKVKGLRLAVYPNSSINVRGIEQQLDLWEQTEGFVADLVILDYPDIMAPDDARKEKRHQEDERWRLLRKLTQERHVCLITATQSNRGGFDDRDLAASDTSEDKRKLDHVTAFFALNQTEEEHERGIVRIANLLMREGKKSRSQVTVLQSLETGQPYLASYWKRFVKKKKGGTK